MELYEKDGRITIRSMKQEDARIVYDIYASYGWHPQMETYETYYKEQNAGTRKVFIAEYEGKISGICTIASIAIKAPSAEYEGKISGICTLVLNSMEGPWAGQGYPEIVDLCVFFISTGWKSGRNYWM